MPFKFMVYVVSFPSLVCVVYISLSSKELDYFQF